MEEGRVEVKGVRNSKKRKLTLTRALRWNRVQSIQGTESQPAGREWLVGLNSMERNWEETDGEVPCQPQWDVHDTSPPSCVPSVTLTSTLTNRPSRQLLRYDVNRWSCAWPPLRIQSQVKVHRLYSIINAEFLHVTMATYACAWHWTSLWPQSTVCSFHYSWSLSSLIRLLSDFHGISQNRTLFLLGYLLLSYPPISLLSEDELVFSVPLLMLGNWGYFQVTLLLIHNTSCNLTLLPLDNHFWLMAYLIFPAALKVYHSNPQAYSFATFASCLRDWHPICELPMPGT